MVTCNNPVASEKLVLYCFKGMVEGVVIKFNNEVKPGNIMKLKDVPIKTKVYCIESRPNDGGKFIKTGDGDIYAENILKKRKNFI